MPDPKGSVERFVLNLARLHAPAAECFEILALYLSDPSFTPRTDSVAEQDLAARLAVFGLDGSSFSFVDLDGADAGCVERGTNPGNAP